MSAQKTDHHHLESIPGQSYGGIYTMETFVHAIDREVALLGFYYILRPSGRLALFEYDNELGRDEGIPQKVANRMNLVNKYAVMPINARSY